MDDIKEIEGFMRDDLSDKMIVTMHIECERRHIAYIKALKHSIDKILEKNNDPYNTVLLDAKEAEILRMDTDGSKLYKE